MILFFQPTLKFHHSKMARAMGTPPRFMMLSLVLTALFDIRQIVAVTQPEFPEFSTPSRITLSGDRGYRDVLIAIGDSVPEDDDLIEEIMEVFTEFSKFLHPATNVYGNGVFFEEVSILIPSDWSDDSRYVSRTWETFEASDVRVDNPPTNALSNRNRPSTNKATSCGAPGSFIHLTPDYITDDAVARRYGDRSRTLTHEWGHFRWGVFDEYPLPGDDHFYATSMGTYEATKCVSAITGENRNPDGSQCSLDPISGQPDEECRFIDDRESETYEASLMYKQFLPEMRTFCDSEEVTGFRPSTTHNALAPNQQNIQCASRSIWEVMRNHSDFPSTVPTDSLPPIGALPQVNVVPNFRLVKPRRSRDPIVLILDTSGSMGAQQRLHVLRQASFNLITHVLHEDQLFAVVTFNHMTRVAIDLAEAGQDRSRLVDALPKGAGGGTTIGGGILEGVDVLKRNLPDSYSGAQMILLTDGEETLVQPFIRNVSDSELAGIIVHTIAIGPDATSELEGVATRTGGRTFEHSDRSAALFNIFTQVAIRDVSDVITIISSPFNIQNFRRQFSPGVLSGDTITILIGLPLGFLPNTTVSVIKPNGDVIGKNSQPAMTDRFEEIPDFELIQIYTDVMPGVWEISVEFTLADSQNLTGTMHVETTRRQSSGGKAPTSGVNGVAPAALPIGIDARWGLPTIDPCQIQTVQVTVSQGYTPVSEANVEVLVSRPNTTDPKVTLEVYDDGLGADVRKDDGVYTAFFTDFKGEGRYNMEVSVTGKEGVTKLMNDNRVGGGPSAPDPEYIDDDSKQPSNQFTGAFNRFIGGSSFTCTNAELCSGDKDIYPPYRITDLRITLKENMTAELTFTATGDDLDRGTASRYEIRVAKNITDLVKRFDSTQVVGITDSAPPFVSVGDLDAPQPSRQPERFEVKLPDEVGEFSYIFGIVAVDDGGRRSRPSNFASVTANPVGPSLVLLIILIIIVILIICFIVVLAICLYRRRTKSKGDKDTESIRHLPNYEHGNSQVKNGVIIEDPNANNQEINEAFDHNYPFVSVNPSTGTAVTSDYADKFAGGAQVSHYALQDARKVYVTPSEIAEPIQGMRNPVFNRDDLATPPDHPTPRRPIAEQSPSGLDDDKEDYENVNAARNRHVMNMMRGGPAGPVLPPKVMHEEDNTHKAPMRAPRPAARPRTAGPSTSPRSAPGADESDDEHDYDEPPPTRISQQPTQDDSDSDSDKNDYEPVLDPNLMPLGLA